MSRARFHATSAWRRYPSVAMSPEKVTNVKSQRCLPLRPGIAANFSDWIFVRLINGLPALSSTSASDFV
jgi:hypothetical protein